MVLSACLLICNLLLLVLVPFPGGLRAQGEPKGTQAEQRPDTGSEKGFADALSFASRREPIYIQADGLEFDYHAKRVVYRGSVVVTQGDVAINSDVLTITYEDGSGGQRLKEAVATGNVIFTKGNRQARGEKAVFDEKSRTVTLSGNAVVHDGPSQVEGETIVVFLDEDRLKVMGGKERVKAVFHLPNPALSPVEGEAAAGEEGRP